MISKYYFLLKGSRAPQINGCFQRWSRENTRMSMKQLVVPENKEGRILKPVGEASN